ncbi:hypothetical protein HMI55_007122 [Coelomomyces lativittatus]|nr:hypothetical protein HMI55_007122 [Coelomomyces lativittatus]
MEKNVATFPDIPCQIKYDPESRDIDVAFDKVDHSDFKSLIEACLTELMLEINV